MAAADPITRQLSAKIAANTRWSKAQADGAKALKPARDARLRQFETLADPKGELTPAVRRQKALSLRKAHMQSLALLSKTRRAGRVRDNGTPGPVGD